MDPSKAGVICYVLSVALSTISSIWSCYAVIKNFGTQIGADGKQVQGLIRLAKKNGEKLGFLS